MQIIQHARTEHWVSYSHDFRRRHDAGSGYTFACGANGTLTDPNPDRLRNYERCLDGTYDVIDEGIVKRQGSYLEPAIGRCDCGREVVLSGFTNSCECGRDYNHAGMLLASRRHWGEETGEHWSECI